MADLTDYLEATAGTMGGGGGEGELDLDDFRARLLQRLERDALLCLVDCRASMFTAEATGPAGASAPARSGSVLGQSVASPAAPPAAATAAVVKVEKESASPSRGSPPRGQTTGARRSSSRNTAVVADEEQRDAKPQSAPPRSATAFETAMRCILKLFQEKIISSDKDLLSLVLYNTAENRNPYDFPGVYVLHPFNLLGADSVQEVEQLIAAGTPDSAAYKQFLQEAGHRPSGAPSALSDALWAAQHMFLNVRTAAVKYRRIFVFTDDDEPTSGSAVEYRRCCARVRDLYEAGVALEVFGMGRAGVKEEVVSSVATGSGHGTGVISASFPTATATTTAPLTGSLFATLHHPNTLEASGSVPGTVMSTTTTTTTTAATAAAGTEGGHFVKHRFWEPLLRDATAAADTSLMSANSLDSDASLSAPQHYAGSVYVNDLLEVLDVVRRKVHPQRPFLNCNLQIGLRSDGGALPRMAVSVYVPLMRADPPKTEWLEGSTNALIKRRSRLVRRTGGGGGGGEGDDDDEGNDDGEAGGGVGVSDPSNTGDTTTTTVIRPEETCYTALVGGHHVYFTAAERAKITEVAAAGAEAGLFIICFKRYEDVIQHKHVTERSCFLHANLRQGGPESVRLFAQLVRSLRKKGRVGIALYRMRHASKPKLVALIPSPDPGSHTAAARAVAPCVQFPVTSLAAEGLGLYLLPLPFADDLRQVPSLQTTTSVTRNGAVKMEDDAVTPADVQLAQEVVRRLTVDYDITAVSNPTLQLVYQNLQDMALRDLASGGGASSLDRFAVHDAASGADTVLTRDRVEDYTLPDEEGMRRYAALFHDFNTHVLGPDYNADKYCPLPAQRKTAGQRRPHDGADDDEAGADKKGVKREYTPRGGTTGVKKEAKNEEDDGADGDSITAIADEAAKRDAWHTMTVPQLKDYIKAMRGGSVTGKKKDELIVMAKKLHH